MSAPSTAGEANPTASAPPRRWLTPERLGLGACLALFVLGTAVRLYVAAQGVESPGIDENEVVEQAVAFMGGDLRYYFLKYGPLTMYALAGIYHVAALLHGVTALEYASRVFFEGAEHYAIARFYVVGWLSVLALCAFFGFRRHSGVGAALIALVLLAYPVVEVLSPGARIDIPQAAFQGLALVALSEVVGSGRLRYWLLAGACAGLAIATKPLPGLLVIPCFIAAAWFASALPGEAARPWSTRLWAAASGKGLWLAALACVACAALGNPAILDISSFIQSQREAVTLHSGHALAARAEIGDSLRRLGIPFLVLGAGSALLVLVRRDARGLLYGLFIAVYLAALWGRASRDYFLVAPAAAGCLLIARGWALLGELAASALARGWTHAGSFLAGLTWPKATAWICFALVIAMGPVRSAEARATKPNPSTEARDWIESHVPSGSRIFHVGWRPSGPLLVATDEKVQARWGDHFDYGREKYAFLKQAFHLGYSNYMASDEPRYRIDVYDGRPTSRASKQTPRWVTDKLLANAQKDKTAYIILAGYRERDYTELGYRWFADAQVAAEFRKITIFKVPAPTPVALTSGTPPPPPAPAP